jgi:uncharacterized RDD family membrane protein YckC
MRCAACGAVSTGAGRCSGCGAVIPLPGEDGVLEHPVSVTLFLDRRNRSPDGPGAHLAPAALTRNLDIDRREEPRPVHGPAFDPVRPVARAAAEAARYLRHVAAVAPVASAEVREGPRSGGPGAGRGDFSLAREVADPDDFEVTLEEDGDAGLPDELADALLLPPAPPAWRRLLAWAIDGALVAAVPLVAVAAATHGVTGEDGAPVPFAELLAGSGSLQLAAVALGALTAFVYLTLSSAVGGRTPGAALAGLGLVSCESGDPPGLARSALRAALAVAGVFAFLAGPLSALLDGRGRALHDKLAGTVVLADR